MNHLLFTTPIRTKVHSLRQPTLTPKIRNPHRRLSKPLFILTSDIRAPLECKRLVFGTVQLALLLPAAVTTSAPVSTGCYHQHGRHRPPRATECYRPLESADWCVSRVRWTRQTFRSRNMNSRYVKKAADRSGRLCFFFWLLCFLVWIWDVTDSGDLCSSRSWNLTGVMEAVSSCRFLNACVGLFFPWGFCVIVFDSRFIRGSVSRSFAVSILNCFRLFWRCSGGVKAALSFKVNYQNDSWNHSLLIVYIFTISM